MELGLSLCNPQAPAPPNPSGNLILGLCSSMESAMESKHQELHRHNDPDDLPLQLGLQSTAQPKRTLSPGSGEDSAGSRGSEDEEKDLSLFSRKKMRLSKEQSVHLEESFNEHQTLNPKQKVGLAEQLGLRPRQVEVWFQNRRARTKLKQTEMDCSYLKQCYDTLTADNRRLQKELGDLRALKAAQPFNMQLPATTLSLCPSCKRISPNGGGGGDHRRANSFAALLDKGGFFPLVGSPYHKPSAA